MNELQIWVNALGPTGAILALGVMFMRGLWPWVRDQYLAPQVEALNKLVVLMTSFNERQAAMETTLAELRQNAAAQAQDTAAIFTVLHQEQPSRPRARAAGATARGG